jgi:hypothetical protein
MSLVSSVAAEEHRQFNVLNEFSQKHYTDNDYVASDELNIASLTYVMELVLERRGLNPEYPEIDPSFNAKDNIGEIIIDEFINEAEDNGKKAEVAFCDGSVVQFFSRDDISRLTYEDLQIIGCSLYFVEGPAV